MKLSIVKDALREIGRESLEDLIDTYGEKAIKAAVECDISWRLLKLANDTNK